MNAMNWSALSSLPVWAQVTRTQRRLIFFVHDMMVMSGKALMNLCNSLYIFVYICKYIYIIVLHLD